MFLTFLPVSLSMCRGGLDVLYKELAEAMKSGPALAFMATMIKDYGAVDESVALYYKVHAYFMYPCAHVFMYIHACIQEDYGLC